MGGGRIKKTKKKEEVEERKRVDEE